MNLRNATSNLAIESASDDLSSCSQDHESSSTIDDSFEPLYTKSKPLDRKWNGLSDYIHPFKYRNFIWYFVASFIDSIGIFFYILATQLALLQRVNNDVGRWAHFDLVKVPAIVLASFVAGVVVDRFDRKRVLVITNTIQLLIVPINVYVILRGSLAAVLLMQVVEAVVGAFLQNGYIMPLLVPESHGLQFASTLITWARYIFGLTKPWTGKVIGRTGLVPAAGVKVAASIITIFCYAYGLRGDFKPTRESKHPSHHLKDEKNCAKRTFLPVKDMAVYLTTCGFGALTLMYATANAVSGSIFLNVNDLALLLLPSGQLDKAATGQRFGINKALQQVSNILGPVIFNIFTDATRPKSLQRSAIFGLAFLLLSSALMVPASICRIYWLDAVSDFFREFGVNLTLYFSKLALLVLADKEMYGRLLGFQEGMGVLFRGLFLYVSSALMTGGRGDVVSSWIGVGLGAFFLFSWSIYHYMGKGSADPRFNLAPGSDNDTALATVIDEESMCARSGTQAVQ